MAPTVMRLLGERAPAESAGRFLAEAFEPVAAARRPMPAARAGGAACAGSAGFRSVSVRPRGRGLRFGFRRRGLARRDRRRLPALDRVVRRRATAGSRASPARRKAFTWRGRGARNGQPSRGCAVAPGGGPTVRRVALARRGGASTGGPRSTAAHRAARSPRSSSSPRVRRAHEPRRLSRVPPRCNLSRAPAAPARQGGPPPRPRRASARAGERTGSGSPPRACRGATTGCG